MNCLRTTSGVFVYLLRVAIQMGLFATSKLCFSNTNEVGSGRPIAINYCMARGCDDLPN